MPSAHGGYSPVPISIAAGSITVWPSASITSIVAIAYAPVGSSTSGSYVGMLGTLRKSTDG
jgi:hypothetical protein